VNRNFTRNISFNAVQLIINQLLGLFVFYLLSKSLTKADFGELNWCLAVLLTLFNLLSFGIDQILVKKIAAGKRAAQYLSLYFFHVLLTGSLFYGILILCYIFFPFFNNQHSLLLLLAIGKLLFFFSSPFKQLANGLEQFKLLIYMSTCSNIFKGIGLILLIALNKFTLLSVVIVFVTGDLTELLVSFYMVKKFLKTTLHIRYFKLNSYSGLLKESLPQLGVVLFSAALARFDWICIGWFTTTTKLAEYSFVYKVFEIATLPLLIIAPLLVPFFTKLLAQNAIRSYTNRLAFLLRFEIIIASLIALLLNVVWVPVIDALTNGKYGSVNRNTLFILSLCMPLLYLNNFLWSIHFSMGRLKMIFHVFAVTFGINILANLLLIPLYQNEGAATAYFIAIFTQSVLYLIKTSGTIVVRWQPLIICAGCAFLSGIISKSIPTNYIAVLGIALSSYLLFLLLTTQIGQSDWRNIKRAIGR
jgi:O-antigen/teichoic acid export membrane protein